MVARHMKNYSDEFERFWAAWPSPKDPAYLGYKRKTDKVKCFELWNSRGYDKIFDQIIRDVEQRKKYDKGWLQQKGEFLSAPLVYLRNERWEGSEWADVRDERKATVSPIKKDQEDTGPFYSRWACYANKLLVRKQMQDPRRARFMCDEQNFARAMKAKNDLVREVEADAAKGERWDDRDFMDVIGRALDRALSPEDLTESELLAQLHAR